MKTKWMKRGVVALAVASALVAPWAGAQSPAPDAGAPTRAQEATKTDAATTGAATGAAPGPAPAATRGDVAGAGVEFRASELIGRNVENARGENLGEVKDLIVDTTNGKVHYAVLSFGGILGLGDKLFAIPLDRFATGGERGKLRLDVDKEQLRNARGIDQKQWPNLADPAVRADLVRPFGRQAPPEGVKLARASKLVKADVKDRAGKDVGDVEDIVVNLRTGDVHYVVVEFDRAWHPDDKLVAMPMKAFRAEDGDRDDLVYQADRAELRSAPSFERDKWPDAGDARFRESTRRYEQTWLNQPAR